MANGFVSLGGLFWFLCLLTSPCVTSSHVIYSIFFSSFMIVLNSFFLEHSCGFSVRPHLHMSSHVIYLIFFFSFMIVIS